MKKSVARLGVGGPVGSGKTALLERLLPLLMQQGIEVAVVTNDLLTQEDADRLKRQGVLPASRIVGVETGSCPHTAIREDPTMNLLAIRNLERAFPELDLVFVESGGDNLASTFSYDLIDAYIFVLDVGLCLTQFEQVTTSSMLYFVDAWCPCFVDAGQIGSVSYRLADGQHELGCLVLALFGCCSVCNQQVDMSTLQQSAVSLIAPYECLLYF